MYRILWTMFYKLNLEMRKLCSFSLILSIFSSTLSTEMPMPPHLSHLIYASIAIIPQITEICPRSCFTTDLSISAAQWGIGRHLHFIRDVYFWSVLWGLDRAPSILHSYFLSFPSSPHRTWKWIPTPWDTFWTNAKANAE